MGGIEEWGKWFCGEILGMGLGLGKRMAKNGKKRVVVIGSVFVGVGIIGGYILSYESSLIIYQS